MRRQHTLCLGEHAVDGAGAAAAAHGDVVLEFLRHVERGFVYLFVWSVCVDVCGVRVSIVEWNAQCFYSNESCCCMWVSRYKGVVGVSSFAAMTVLSVLTCFTPVPR